jgi:hypothetical protein
MQRLKQITEGKRHCKENIDCCPKICKNQQAKNIEMTMQKGKRNYPRPKSLYIKAAMMKSSYSKD